MHVSSVLPSKSDEFRHSYPRGDEGTERGNDSRCQSGTGTPTTTLPTVTHFPSLRRRVSSSRTHAFSTAISTASKRLSSGQSRTSCCTSPKTSTCFSERWKDCRGWRRDLGRLSEDRLRRRTDSRNPTGPKSPQLPVRRSHFAAASPSG
jgi:hypothetical protein